MIKVYVNVNSIWRRIYNAENISLTSEIGGRIPSFSFSLPDKNFLFSIFNTESPYFGFLKKGNKVKIVKDDVTVVKGYLDEPKWKYPEQIVTVQCKGTLSKLQEDNFQGSDWSYESGTFSVSIPSSRYVDMSSLNATAVWGVKVNGSYFYSYEWNAEEQKIIITNNATGTISGKYMAAVSPHDFFADLLDGYDNALVPLVNGTDDYVFSALNLVSGAELDGIDEALNGTGEVITRPIDLGKYSTGFGIVTFTIHGLITAYVRGGDKRNIAISNSWVEITSGTDLNTIYGRFVRFLQFKFEITSGSGTNNITISLTGNAPEIEKIKFEDENKFTVLQRLAECYQCYLFEDRFGTLRMEHKEVTEDWEDTLAYLKFTGMEVAGNYSPKTVTINGLVQKFTWLTGDMAGTEYTIKHRGSVVFEGDDLTGEVTIDNQYAWSEDILQNVALCYQPAPIKIKLNTNAEYELGDLVKIQTVYLEATSIYSRMMYVDGVNSMVPYVDILDTEIPYISTVLMEANAAYRVVTKIFKDELTWDYELDEVHRFPFKFYNLYEYDSWSSFDFYDDIIVSTEPEVVFVWDGEDWTTPDYDYNPEAGEVNIPNLSIPEITTPTIPIIPGEEIPTSPIVLIHKPQTPQPNWQSYFDGLNQYRWFWDVWNCDYPLDNTVEAQWWEKDIGYLIWGSRTFGTGNLSPLVSVNNGGSYHTASILLGTKLNEFSEVETWIGSGVVVATQWDSWKSFLELVASQGKEVQFRKGPFGQALSMWISIFSMKKKDGTNPSSGTTLEMKVYAITEAFNPLFLNQAGIAALQKEYLAEFVVEFISWTTTTVNPATVQYETIEELIQKDYPYYGLYFEPQWTSDYYIQSTNLLSLSHYFVLDTEADNETSAQGSVMKWKPGYGYSPELSITTGVWYEKWPDLPEYFFKLWRGFTFEMRFRTQSSILDEVMTGLKINLNNFKDGKYCRDFSLYFETSTMDDYGKTLDGLYFYIGYDVYNGDATAVLENNTWQTLRLVLLGVLKYKEIYDGDDITNWSEGEFVSFTDEANVEYFKDVNDSTVHYKGNPSFTGYAAVYLNNVLVWSETLDSKICTELSDYGIEFMDYAVFEMILDPQQEGSWFFDYLKMTDKAMDIQSGFDVEHLVLKP